MNIKGQRFLQISTLLQEEKCSYGRSLKKRHRKSVTDQASVIDGLRTLFAVFFRYQGV